MEQLLTNMVSGGLGGGIAVWLVKTGIKQIFERDRVRYGTKMDVLLEGLRSRISKELFIHRLQFEKEFEVYVDLWKEVRQTGKAAGRFRGLSVGQFESRVEKLKTLHDAYNDLNARVYDYRPFYAPRIYELTTLLLDKVSYLIRDQNDSRRAAKRQDETEELLDQINELVPTISDAIRKRLLSASTHVGCMDGTP